MISRVKEGSIILISDTPLPDGLDAKNGLSDVLSNPAFKQYHGMVYFNHNMYHSQAGEHFEGVRSHAIDHVMKQLASGMPLGKISVIECVDEDLRQRLINVMTRWDPLEFLKQKREERQKQEPSASDDDSDDDAHVEKLPIPFMNYYARITDPKEQSARCELYRALRAYQRNHVEPPEPLSRKGISCDGFIAYSFKVAIVEALFPNGLPAEIIQKMAEIDALRSENKVERYNKSSVMKLADIANIPYLDALMQLVEKHISPAQRRHFEFLQTFVKGAGLDYFCQLAISFPEFWQAAGLMFAYKDKDTNIPYVMDFDAYKALRKPDIAAGSATDLLLSAARVDEVVAELNPAPVASPPAQKKAVKTGENSSLFKQSSEAATSPVTRTKSPGSKQ